MSFWEFWTSIPIKLQRETITFVLINLGDIIMTWRLLTSHAIHPGGGRGNFYESNPVAGYILNHWGLPGMIYFKTAMVGVVVLITQIIAQSKLPLARKILNFGSVVVLCVVFYSIWLLRRHAGPPGM
ncbi:MAG: hypothetical protein KDA65_08230 [Planctomycetaceae bacterium]|nr:hypothetical protein [Planctomycetaceae bacterium]